MAGYSRKLKLGTPRQQRAMAMWHVGSSQRIRMEGGSKRLAAHHSNAATKLMAAARSGLRKVERKPRKKRRRR